MLSLGAIALPIHVWAIVNVLIVIPAWMLRASLGELAGAISYPLVDALLESCVVWGLFIGISYALPRKWFSDHFVALSSALGWLLAGWAMAVQFTFLDIIVWDTWEMILGVLGIVVSLGLVYWLVRRFMGIQNVIKTVVQRLMVLTYFYMLFDLAGLVIIIVRNV
jgi:hypothetical protein